MPDAASVVIETIHSILRERSADVEVLPASDLFRDLDLDSLEVAELSAVLEDTMGTDPYSAGELPTTVAEIVEFYVRIGA